MYNRDMIEDYLTTRQASAKYGLSQAHIRRLLEAGTLRGVKAGHDWLAQMSSLEEYMANRPRRGKKPKPGRKRRKVPFQVERGLG